MVIDDTWWRLDSYCGRSEYYQFDGNIALTNGSGGFSLHPCSCQEPDSIAVAVLLPDTMILSASVCTTNLYVYEMQESYSYEEDGFLCDNTVSGSYLRNYLYEHVDSLDIPVP